MTHSYSDIVNEDVVLLFELFDDQPSLTARKKSTKQNLPIPLAWAYLLPIGNHKDIHVGLKSDWDPKVVLSPGASQSPSKDAAEPKERSWRTRKTDETSNKPDAQSDEPSSHKSDNSTTTAVKKVDLKLALQNVDKAIRIQWYRYVEHDGMLGWVQRKIMGWPSCKYPREMEMSVIGADGM